MDMGFMSDTLGRLVSRDFGFKMDETMSGWHEFEPGMGPEGRLKMEFTATWGPNHVGEWMTPGSDRYFRQELEGTVTAEGLCEDVPCSGWLDLRYFSDHTLRYSFEFEVGGKRYRYNGEKVNIMPWNLPVSHTTCFGRITEAETGKLVSTGVTHFRVHTIPRWLASFRFV